MMRSIVRSALIAALVLPLLAAGVVSAQDAKPPTAVPAQAVADPKPDDTNAQRAISQPGNNAPFWRAVRESGNSQGYVSLPGSELGTLIQPFTRYPGSSLTTAGEAWRQVRNEFIIPYGGSLLLIVVGALALFYWRVGSIGGHEKETGRLVERFTYFERSAHWANAIAFVVLAVSGVIMAFGKFFLLPIVGATLFGWLTYALKTVHNFVGPLFIVSLLVVLATFVRDNMPAKGDLNWLLKGGGMLSEHEVPSHRFNAGEKLVFWLGVFLLGLVVAGSGALMDKIVPGVEYTRGLMQIAHMVHGVSAVLMMAMFLGHIYLGTLGVKGAYVGMRTGYVDESWARENHELWYDDIKAGRIPAQRTAGAEPPTRPAAQT